MTLEKTPKPISIESINAKKGQTFYPPPFNAVVAGRTKKKLGDVFGLSNFGVNHTTLEPGSASALAHTHGTQDEFIYILEGTPTVAVGEERHLMKPGECLGFKANTGLAHQLVNHSDANVVYIEIGDRSPNDNVEYPNDDLNITLSNEGAMLLTRNDGTPY